MNEEVFNISIRQFLKRVGVGSQREIEHAVQAALRDGRIADHTSLPCRMTLQIDSIKLEVVYDGTIELA
jgi:hypothetical protein